MAELGILGQLLEIHTAVAVVVAHILLAAQLVLVVPAVVVLVLIMPMSMQLLAQLILAVVGVALVQPHHSWLVLLEQAVLDLWPLLI
jgi:hypothetical protein